MFYFHDAPGASYDLIHLGMHKKSDSKRICSDDSHTVIPLINEFPQARIACWWLVNNILLLLEASGFMQHAERLLKGLRNLTTGHGTDDRPRKPIMFVCRGMIGGLILKQLLLKLINNGEADKDLYDSVSGIFFLGCAHDERTSGFEDRVSDSLCVESGHDSWKRAVQYDSAFPWIKLTTAKFRNLELPFPVWTYYESIASTPPRGVSFRALDGLNLHYAICCPSENTKLQAAPYRIRILALEHTHVCDILSEKDRFSKLFLNDLRTMVGTLKMSKLMVSIEAGPTRVESIRDLSMTAARDSGSVMVPETHHRSTPSGSPQPMANMEYSRSVSCSSESSDEAVEVEESEAEETASVRSESRKQELERIEPRVIERVGRQHKKQHVSVSENEAEETDSVRGERLRQQCQTILDDSWSKFPGPQLQNMQQKSISYQEPRKLLVDESMATDFIEPYYGSMVTMEDSWSSSGSSIRSDEAVYRMMNEAKERDSVESHKRQRRRVIERFLREPLTRKTIPSAEKAPDLVKALETPGPSTPGPSTPDLSLPSAYYGFPERAKNSQANKPSSEQETLDALRIRSKTPAISDYKVGWICALPFEAAAAEVMLDEQYPDLPLNDHDSTLHRLGRIDRHNVVIACLPRGRPGLSAATAVARDMLEKFRGIKFGLMVGIGGGVPSTRDDIRLGDVVVSQPNLEHGGIVQYDFGKSEEGGKFRRIGHLNNPPTLLLSVLNRVQVNHERGRRTYPIHMSRYAEEDMEEYTHPHNERDVLFNATYPHTGEFDCRNCDPDQIVVRPERKTKNTTVKIHYGTIASGNQVIKDAQTRDRIVRDLGGQVLCFEMEAAGLMNDLPCLVIRGISDYCDSHKNDGWQKYAAASAAAYTRELLLSIPSGDVVG